MATKWFKQIWRSCYVAQQWKKTSKRRQYIIIISLPVLTAIFQVNLGQPVFIEEKYDKGGGDNWTTGAISRAKFQSNHHHNKPTTSLFLQTECPSCWPTNSVKASRENITFHGLAYPKLTWGLPTLSLTTNTSWLPWGRVAMPLISPLMPVPIIHHNYDVWKWVHSLLWHCWLDDSKSNWPVKISHQQSP